MRLHILLSEDTPCPLYNDDTIVEQPADFLMLTENYVKFATSFIKESASKDSIVGST